MSLFFLERIIEWYYFTDLELISSKKEKVKEKQELTPYSFRHRYAYYGHNRSKADGSYRAPKQVADAMGHTLDTHLLSYSRFQTKDLASAFDETTLLVKTAA